MRKKDHHHHDDNDDDDDIAAAAAAAADDDAVVVNLILVNRKHWEASDRHIYMPVLVLLSATACHCLLSLPLKVTK